MTWQTNPAFIAARGITRKMGLNRLLGGLRSGGRYEREFDEALFATLGEGDIIWDVGANVGYYTKRFAEAAGSCGKVIAFEPFPTTFSCLKSNLQGSVNCEVHAIALGAEAGRASMRVGDEADGAANRISENYEQDAVEIEIATGDEFLNGRDADVPTVIKIDTEGYELDVLQGMPKLMTSPSLRALFIEVHFGLLAERGMANAPSVIVGLLKAAGFDVKWVDPSHIAAIRNR